jgi:predicted extracellular nuclease
VLVSIVAAVVAAMLAVTGPAAAVSPDIVVGQVYGGGGNSGAPWQNDFIELFNRGAAPVDVTGWSVQYASAGGSTWQVTALSGAIPPGGYYLVQEAAGANPATPLPTPDATGSIAMSATSGKVALLTTTTPLTCGATPGSCLPNPSIRDFVGYGGSANNFEGAAATGTLSNTTAALRANDGCTDTDQNGADFAVGPPTPRNSASPSNPCATGDVVVDCGTGPLVTDEGTAATRSVSATDPDGTVVTFDIAGVDPAPAAGSITVGDVVPAPSPGGTAAADVTVDADVPAGSYTVEVRATNDDATPQSGSCLLAVEVRAPAVTIPEIQGDGARSALDGTVQRTTGVVTVILGSGFFIQDPVGDGDPATSDGLFLFTGSAAARTVAPGDVLDVIGTVSEFRPASRPRDLTLTELTGVSFTITGTAPLPDAVAIADRPDVEISPAGIESFEALEGMRVAVDDPLVAAPANAFGEFVTVASGDVGSSTPRGNLIVGDLAGDAVDYNPERIMVDDESRLPGGTGSGTRIMSPQVQVRTGDAATGDVVGVLDYQFSNYRVQPESDLVPLFPGAGGPVSAPGAPEPEPYEARVATFNVENLFDCVDAPGKDDDHPTCDAGDLDELETKLAKLIQVFEDEMGAPELAIVEETENAEVLTGDAAGDVPGTDVPALLPRLPGSWEAVSFDASDERGIEVAFVFDTERVTLLEAFPATDLLPDEEGVFDGSVFRAGREPLVGRFLVDDVELVVIGNHFKSKGGPQFGIDPAEAGDDPLTGEFQPPTRWTEEVRHLQADYVRELTDLLLAAHPGTMLLVGGDLNDFAFGEPGEGQHTVERIASSATDPLVNLVDRVAEEERYTFLFEGNSQVLDHLLANEALEAAATRQAIVHVNADYPDVLGADASVPFRASDHDPLIGYFCSDATAPSLALTVKPDRLWPPNHAYRSVQVTIAASDDRDPSVQVRLVSVTSDEPDDAPGGSDGNTVNDIVVIDDDTFRLRAERDETRDGRVYLITYEATDACGNATTRSVAVRVPLKARP